MDDLFNAMLSGNDDKKDDTPDMGDMLRNLMGGDNAEGGIAGMLGGLMGGGGDNPIVDTVAGMLSERLGLSPEISRTVVTFVMDKIVGGSSGRAGESLDLQGLMGSLGDAEALQNSGLAQELAEKSGLDADTAASSLQQVASLLGGQGSQGGGLGDLFGK